MELHILDTSNYLYAGSYNNFWVGRGVRESDGQYQANEAPMGGVRFLLSQAQKFCSSNSIVMPVFDRAPTIKRKMYFDAFGDEYGYKGNRDKSDDKKLEIENSKWYAEAIMSNMGFQTQSAEGYEADDVIYSLVLYYRDDFEKIYIHTRDSDLTFLVSDNVEIAKVGDKGKCIDLRSYPELARTGEYTWYNTLNFIKLYYGDKSDNIPGVGKEWVDRVDSVIPAADYPKLGDLDLARKYLREVMSKYPTAPNSHKLIEVFNILSPLKVPYELLNDEEPDVDYRKLNDYYLQNWNRDNDQWGLEDLLSEYIDKFYE